MADELLGKNGKGRRTPAGRQGVGASGENGNGGQRRKLNGRRRERDRDEHDRGIHLAMQEHGDGAFVTGLVGVGVQQLVQSGGGDHGVQQQDQRDQQRGDERLAGAFKNGLSRLQAFSFYQRPSGLGKLFR